MAKIAFLGLGQMGTPMAARLIEAGNEVTVWNRTRAKTESLVEHGAAAAETPGDAVAGADAVVTMLANPAALEQVLFADDGVVSALSPGQWLIEMSTVGPDTIRSVRRRLPAHVTLVDAPVRGSVPEATAGRLAIFVGATEGTSSTSSSCSLRSAPSTMSADRARARLPSWSPTLSSAWRSLRSAKLSHSVTRSASTVPSCWTC